MIQPVICQVESNRDSVQRLVKHCKDLDQTDVKVVVITPEEDAQFKPQHPDNDKACRASFSLHRVALEMKGQPFIWLEHDSIPLKPKWAEALTAEYKKRKKPYMLASDSRPPYDITGGIGVYGPDTHWMIPVQLRREPLRCIGWDLWMLRNIPELISHTPLIQHSYGIYDSNGIASPHRFPRDKDMLRPEAVIFHADKEQSLLGRNPVSNRTFHHSGDIGDLVYHLEVIRRMGGGDLYLSPELGVKSISHTREPMSEKRFAFIESLIKAQPYINELKLVAKPSPDWINLNLFREKLKPKENLQRACLRRFDRPPQDETQPWLSVPKPRINGGYIAIARSPRYHREEGFPWHEIMAAHRDYCLFVGLLSEHQDFVNHFGPVTYASTKDLLHLATVINDAQCFIGNQSSPYAIAEGLKKPAVQETWTQESNCIFERPHLLHSTSDFRKIDDFIRTYVK